MILIQPKKDVIAIALFVVTSAVWFVRCGSQEDSPIKIQSARRAYKLLVGDSMQHQKLTPFNPETHVVLDLRIDGISTDDFNNADKDSKSVTANGGIFRPNITTSGIKGGKKIIRLCVIIPKEKQELTVHIGSFPPKRFRVKGEIYDELKDW